MEINTVTQKELNESMKSKVISFKILIKLTNLWLTLITKEMIKITKIRNESGDVTNNMKIKRIIRK